MENCEHYPFCTPIKVKGWTRPCATCEKARQATSHRRTRERRRQEALQHYGKVCVLCNKEASRVVCGDAEWGKGAKSLFQALAMVGYPKDETGGVVSVCQPCGASSVLRERARLLARAGLSDRQGYDRVPEWQWWIHDDL